MTRLLFYALSLTIGCTTIFGRWPWHFLRAAPTRQQAVFRARKLLAIEAGATPKEIRDAHRRLIAMVHPDRGGSGSQVHEADAARDLLLDELPRES